MNNILRLKSGDIEALGEIMEEYKSIVFGRARRILPSNEDAEEVTQDVFLKLSRVIDQYDPSKPFTRWLMTITRTLSVDKLRSIRSRRLISLESIDREEVTLDKDEYLGIPVPPDLSLDTRDEVEYAIKILNDIEKLIVKQHYWKDLSLSAIAPKVKASLSKVKIIHGRALRYLRDSLSLAA